jgi:hypothetical protein
MIDEHGDVGDDIDADKGEDGGEKHKWDRGWGWKQGAQMSVRLL